MGTPQHRPGGQFGALRLLRGLAPAGRSPCVLAIGSFDGLHVGHQALIQRTIARAAALEVPAGLLSFEPLPREVLQPDSPPARLTNLRERWRRLQASGLDRFHVLAFNQRLRTLTGLQFMEALRALGARAIVVGHDFRFGHKGAASAQWCAAEARNFGFEVDIVDAVLVDGERVASGLVRSALAAGELVRAARLLGRPYAMRGRVRRGEQLGRQLGFPTANLPLQRRRAPLAGIFAVRVHGVPAPGGGGAAAPRGWPAVASLGTRPTVGGTVPLLEVHLFDFSGELYGLELEVEFVARLRAERRFDSVDAMVAQMHQDAAAARALLAPLV